METPEENNVNPTPKPKPSFLWRWLGRLFRLCIAVAVIAGTGAVAYHWISNPPVTQRRPKGPEAVLVEVVPLNVDRLQVKVQAMGTVVPDTQIQLAARVSGQVVDKGENFSSGLFLAAGEMGLQIDPEDFELAVRQQEANLVKAQSDVQLEMGQQSVAKREYELLQDSMPGENTSLLLREPQLAAKEAAVEIAKATLEKAQLDLERTTIKAPFNCVVLERKVDLGSYITPGTALATLVGTDEFYVEVSVPLDELKWIDFSGQEAGNQTAVKIYNPSAWGGDVYREGVVDNLMPALEAKGRMARVRISVANPLGIAEADMPALLLDSFVRVEIDGNYVDNAAQIPRTAVHSGSSIWVMLPDNTLDIREIEIVWGTSEDVYVTGNVTNGERLVVSDLAAPIVGMKLRTPDMPVGNGNDGGNGSGGDR
jgi:RND family efflux transporter MFP subunit